MSDRPGSASPPSAGSDRVTFEAALGELEAIVDRLEQGEIELEEALRAFEQGVALARQCAEQLGDAERRVEILLREGDGWIARPFAEGEAGDAVEESD
jgi:exodeoxyribonuclease VII small subunit